MSRLCEEWGWGWDGGGAQESSGASSQGVRAVAARADQRQVGSLVLFQQSRDFLVVRVRVQRLVVLVVIFVIRTLLHFLGLRVVLLLGRGHFRRVFLPPFSPAVLKPDLLKMDTNAHEGSTGPNMRRIKNNNKKNR